MAHAKRSSSRKLVSKLQALLHAGDLRIASSLPDAAVLARELQDFVKERIAPYKYPRAIEYVAVLPRTQTGKLQRFELRRIAGEPASHQLAS